MGKLKVLDLFSGIGGFSLGLERTGGFETIAFCEIEEFPRKVLKKHWPNVPIFEDVRNLHAKDIKETVDVVCGGFPCQPASVAGKRRGTEDDRWLWPEIVRCLQEFSPRFGIFENVPGLLTLNGGVVFESVYTDMEREGYSVQPLIIPACAVNAPHRRDRVWIMAHSKRNGCTADQKSRSTKKTIHKQQKWENNTFNIARASYLSSTSQDVADADSQGLQIRNERKVLEKKNGASTRCNPTRGNYEGNVDKREITPRVCRGTDAIPNRVDRIKALGNSVVPQIPEMIGRAILYSIQQNK